MYVCMYVCMCITYVPTYLVVGGPRETGLRGGGGGERGGGVVRYTYIHIYSPPAFQGNKTLFCVPNATRPYTK